MIKRCPKLQSLVDLHMQQGLQVQRKEQQQEKDSVSENQQIKDDIRLITYISLELAFSYRVVAYK